MFLSKFDTVFMTRNDRVFFVPCVETSRRQDFNTRRRAELINTSMIITADELQNDDERTRYQVRLDDLDLYLPYYNDLVYILQILTYVYTT